MSNLASSIRLKFDTELSRQATLFDGTTQLIGTLTNNPVLLLIKNQTNQIIFVSDEESSTKGTTMAIGEEMVLDCVANKGQANTRNWPIGTEWYVTAPVGTGYVKISVIYAQ